MNDTPADVAAALRTLAMQRTESERALMAFGMFDLARTLMIADLCAQNPGITDGELRVKIFERTYGNDFGDADRDRIVARIRRVDVAR